MCISPYVLKNPPYAGVSVPCRNCIECKISRSDEWETRISNEWQSWDNGVFLTLTYDEEHIPKNYSLVKRDLQNFFKRLRYYLKKRKIKYFACGEYGTKKQRPHYHAILLGVSQEEHELTICPNGGYWVESGVLKDAWDKGIIHVGDITNDSIGYVTHYIDKKLTGKLAEENYIDKGRDPPFQLQSQGFGLEYAKKNEKQIKEHLFIPRKGQKKPVPLYYRKKLDLQYDPRFRLMAEKKQEEVLKEHAIRTGIDYTEKLHKLKKRMDALNSDQLNTIALGTTKLLQPEFQELYDIYKEINSSLYESKKQHYKNLKAKYNIGDLLYDSPF
ncbi:MAG: rolling circle replication-associated protein [Brevinema sp.]